KPKYGQRWQVETVNSMLKRRLGSALRARYHMSQCRETILRAITHNVMIVRLLVFYRALQDRFSSPPEASFGLTGAALAKFPGHLGYEQPTLVSSQPSGSRADQGVEALGGSFHDGSLPWCRDSDRYGRSLASYHRGGEAQSRVDLDLPVACL